MLTASALYRAALPYPWRRVARVDVYHDGVFQGSLDSVASAYASEAPGITGGEIQVRLTSRVTRTLSLGVEPSLMPETETDLLAPEQAVLRVLAGIGYPDGSSELFPVFTGRVYEAAEGPAGDVTVLAQDLAADVVGFPFEAPQNSQTALSVVSQIHALITQAVPEAVFGTDDVTDQPVPKLTWDTDRGAALDDLAQAVQGRWYTLGDGSFVVRQYPYATGTPVLDLVDASGGTLMTARRRRSREGTSNSVTVVSERLDGTDPIHVTLRNLDPSSPFMFGGPYGRVGQVTKVQTPLTQAQATLLASQQLTAATALSEQWSISCIPDATIEPGDTLRVSYRGANSVQVVDSIRYPLTAGNMTLETRSSLAMTGSVM